MEKAKAKPNKKSVIYALIGAALVIASLAFSVFRFHPVALRVWQSLKDLGKSIVYYVTDFIGEYGAVHPTVTDIPDEMPSLLPIEWEEFKAKMSEYGAVLISKENFTEFSVWVLEKLVNATPYVYFIFLLIVTFVIIAYINLQLTDKPKRWKEDQAEAAESKPLRVWLKIENATIAPAVRFIKDYLQYLKKKRILKAALILIWIYNFNIYTIAFETLAYVFFFPIAAIDEVNDVKLYSQLVKLVLDLAVPFGFLPWWAKTYFGLLIFEKWRKSAGNKKLNKKDKKNGELLEENPGTIFITGKPRSGKGLIGTDMVLKQETTFRESALNDMRDCRIEFPNFPFDRLERFMRQAIDRHVLYTKEGTRDFIDSLKYMHEHEAETDPKIKELFDYRLKTFCGYEYEDYMFGYDAGKYGTSFNNGIVMVSLYETLVDYAQLYFVYDAPTSLIFSTQGVRVDFKRKTLGYFPKYDLDYLKRKPEEIEEISTYSHRKNYDSERLGRSMNPDDPIKNGYEMGISYDPEIDKERGNQNTNAGVKAEDSEVNPKNDLYNVEEKMHNHATTIRYKSYYRKVIDSQRNGAVSSDITEMTLEFQILESKKEKVVLPFFGIEKDLYEFLKTYYDKIEEEEKYVGKTRTLRAYLLRRTYMPIARRYRRLSNAYGTQEKVLKITNGQGGEVIADKAVWTVIYRRAKAKRYATDGILGLYRKRVVHRSEGGMNDFSLFDGIRNTGEEFTETNSLFYKRFPQYFNGEYEAKRKRLQIEKELREKEKDEREKQKAEKAGKQPGTNGAK